MRRPGRWLLVSGSCLLLFCLHALLVDAGVWQHLDRTLMWWLHSQAGPVLDEIALAITWIGHEGGVIPLDIVLVLLLVGTRRWRLAGFTLSATVGSWALNVAAKGLFERARPQLWPHLDPVGSWSFPSGHAMGSSTLMLVLIVLCWQGRWRMPMLVAGSVFAVLVGITRPYLGVHWPSDVVAGWLLAACWVTLMAVCWLSKDHAPVPLGADNS